jgi:hypothetical protein
MLRMLPKLARHVSITNIARVARPVSTLSTAALRKSTPIAHARATLTAVSTTTMKASMLPMHRHFKTNAVVVHQGMNMWLYFERVLLFVACRVANSFST